MDILLRYSVSTPQTLARKRSMGYAPRIVAGGLDTTSSEDEQGTAVNETGARFVCFTAYIFTDAAHARRFRPLSLKVDISSAESPTKAVRNQPPLSAAKPGEAKPVIDAVASNTYCKQRMASFNKRIARDPKSLRWDLTGAPSPTKAVRNKPIFFAKHVK